LGDRTIAPLLLERLETEGDVGLQLAFAAALGQLGIEDAAGRLLVLLGESANPDARTEFALALARLVGEEHRFIQLQRRVEAEPGTALSQSVTALAGRLSRSPYNDAAMEKALEDSARALARDELDLGIERFCQALQKLPVAALVRPCGDVVRESLAQLGTAGLARPEYAILALHALDCGVNGKSS
jgi:hypothetical protein